MDFRTYDTAFVTKLGAALAPPQKGYWVTVSGISEAVPCLFDLPEEWWSRELDKPVGEQVLPSFNIRRVDIIPDPSRFMPAFRAIEVSSGDENVFNIQRDPAQPVTLLYEVQMAATSQAAMNALLTHAMLRLPSTGYGSSLSVLGKQASFRLNSVRNFGWNLGKKEGRLFLWGYTYAVEAWMYSTECIKVSRILQVDLLFRDGAGYEKQISVTAPEE